MPWISRGLRNGIVTSRYPREADGYGTDFRGAVEVNRARAEKEINAVVEACPTQAVSTHDGTLTLDRGKCILCGRCTEIAPEVFTFSPSFEVSALHRRSLVVPAIEENDGSLATLREELAHRVKTLRRSVHVRHVDAGSDGSDEWEIAALTNPIYDVQRLGIFFTASPRHADLLLVTGVGSLGMIKPLQHTLEVIPRPSVVIAAGVDAISGGMLGESYASSGGVGSLVEVDVFVPGSPATPFGILHGILMAIDLLPSSTSNPVEGVGERPGDPPRGVSI